MKLGETCPRCGSSNVSVKNGIKMCGDCPATWNIIDKKWSSLKHTDAKILRDNEARRLRNEGWKVATKRWDFRKMGQGILYQLAALKEVEPAPATQTQMSL